MEFIKNLYMVFRRMKMKTKVNKRRFLAALSAVLLISAALVTSCMNEQLGDYQGKWDDSIEIPAGKGLIRISVTDTDARTIYPGTLPATSDLFYDIKITSTTPANSAHNKSFERISLATTAVPIVLDVDTYDIVITAWDDDNVDEDNPGDHYGNAIAGYTKTGVEVASGVSTPVAANLRVWTGTGAGTGTFTYNITVPAFPAAPPLTVIGSDYTAAKLEITNSSNASAGGSPINLSVGSNNIITPPAPISLPAGYYCDYVGGC